MQKKSFTSEAMAEAVADRVVEKLQNTPIAAEYLTSAQTARMTAFSDKALEAHRSRGTGPPYYKVGKSVRYRASEVRAWIESREAES